MESVKEKDAYLSDFFDFEKAQVNAEPAWLRDLRRDAMTQFSTLGFPTIKDEAWRFTNVAPIARTQFRPGPGPEQVVNRDDLDALWCGNLGVPRVVFVDGVFRSDLSDGCDQAGLVVGSLRDAWREREATRAYYARQAGYFDHAFVALNTAFAADGAYIEVASGTVLEQPVHVLFVATRQEQPQRIHPRALVVVGRSSQVTIVESFSSLTDGVYFCNPITEVIVGDNSTIDHYRLQHESGEAYHVGMNQVVQGRDTNYRTTALDLGSALTRNDLACVLNGEGGHAELNGLYLLDGKQHVDNFTTLEHAKPHCDSRELFKGILDGEAKGIFRGRIIVRKGAQKTDSKQTNQNLLLSDDALVNTKPQLEIYADDVKCTHGATIGQLDSTALFYLRSRGISKAAARSLLVYAFASELIDSIKVPVLRDQMIEYLTDWLPKGSLVKEVFEG